MKKIVVLLCVLNALFFYFSGLMSEVSARLGFSELKINTGNSSVDERQSKAQAVPDIVLLAEHEAQWGLQGVSPKLGEQAAPAVSNASGLCWFLSVDSVSSLTAGQDELRKLQERLALYDVSSEPLAITNAGMQQFMLRLGLFSGAEPSVVLEQNTVSKWVEALLNQGFDTYRVSEGVLSLGVYSERKAAEHALQRYRQIAPSLPASLLAEAAPMAIVELSQKSAWLRLSGQQYRKISDAVWLAVLQDWPNLIRLEKTCVRNSD